MSYRNCFASACLDQIRGRLPVLAARIGWIRREQLRPACQGGTFQRGPHLGVVSSQNVSRRLVEPSVVEGRHLASEDLTAWVPPTRRRAVSRNAWKRE